MHFEDDEDDDKGIDEDDEDLKYGGLTTPLSPPPPTHQTKSGLAGSGSLGGARNSTASSNYIPLTPESLKGSPDANDALGGTIKILFSPTYITASPSPTSSTSTATALVYRNPGPPVVMPIAGTARSLTTKQLPAVHPSLRPPTADDNRFAFRESRWPRAVLTRSIASLSPTSPEDSLSPILPPMPNTTSIKEKPAPAPTPAPMSTTTSIARRKTLLERIEGWWDLGLLRGGTIRRGAESRPVAAQGTTMPVSVWSRSTANGRSGRTAASEMDMMGQSPATFV